MIVGFTGSRDIKNISQERLGELKDFIYDNIESITYVVHGGAIGMDSYFHDICIDILPVFVRPAYKQCRLRGIYEQAKPKKPLNRNRDIVNECDLLIAVPTDPDNEELKSGTWATVRYARNNKKQIKFI